MRKLALLFLTALSLQAEEKKEIGTLSEALGHLIGKNLQSLDLPLDLDALVKGLKDEAEGKASPLADEEYERAMATLQEESHEKTALKNLQDANEFLERNEKEEGVVTLEKGKLQYKVEKEGGGRVIEAYNTPLIRFQGKALNGEMLQSDYEEETINLEEALAGLKRGMVGMKEGEKRTLYIHPDFGYGKETHVPNALLIFNIEVLKADIHGEITPPETSPPQ